MTGDNYIVYRIRDGYAFEVSYVNHTTEQGNHFNVIIPTTETADKFIEMLDYFGFADFTPEEERRRHI